MLTQHTARHSRTSVSAAAASGSGPARDIRGREMPRNLIGVLEKGLSSQRFSRAVNFAIDREVDLAAIWRNPRDLIDVANIESWIFNGSVED
jgi:hypothetical protein